MGLPVVAAGVVTSAYDALPPAQKAKLEAWLKRASGTVVSSAKQMVNYAGKGEANSVIAAEGLVRHGANPDAIATIFDGSPNAAKIRASLISVGRNLIDIEDKARPGLNGTAPDAASDMLRRELVERCIRAFGSIESARKVQMALATLRSEDWAWYQAVIQS